MTSQVQINNVSIVIEGRNIYINYPKDKIYNVTINGKETKQP